MSFNRKDINKFDIDDLNIKDRLNASLESEGISVSEDLIRRTLDAINKQKVDDLADINKDGKYIKPASLLKRTRFLVTAAAAAIIFLVGMSAIRILSPQKKADKASPSTMESADNAGYAQKAAMDTDASESGFANEETAKSMDKGTDDYKLCSEEKSGDTSDMFAADTDTKKDVSMGLTSVIKRDGLGFDDIAYMESADVKSVKITSLTSGKEITLAGPDQVKRFYSVMENHSFIPETAGQTDGQYIIEIQGDGKESKITIGTNYIEADTTDNDTVSHGLYSTTDYGKLMEDLEELLKQ